MQTACIITANDRPASAKAAVGTDEAATDSLISK